ncbi:D-alanyl-lipoteichoic acid acyltransferase DltB (MBOAT superfamily) [Variovorax paradoxus]|uniref:MBOAT family O-acyltransferase n=1 Tax=Variovorax paradoxus TaxID=34073 RepID=UPI003397976D
MLFNSLEFLFAFLPLTLFATWLAIRWGGQQSGIFALTCASIFFYGWWEVGAVLVLGASVAFNFTIAQKLAEQNEFARRKKLLVLGVACNLFALGYFKYANFFVENVAATTGWRVQHLHIVLPLAISFYTFQQIAFLVDTYRGQVGRVAFKNYLISVVFFPHLIAGPLLHYRDIIRQFETKFALSTSTLSAGFPVFLMGLFKKVAIADPIAQFVSPLFAKAQSAPLDFVEAWAASLGYTAQLYFDFSGYSDMAIGLGLMFGITLPLNFFSPYKATSIIEFWRRWHMTLSSFLRDYLYIPLGGSRVHPARRYVNLMIVMLLGGLWHGAAWTFAFWGALHGLFLVVNHLWRHFVPERLDSLHRLLTPVYGVLTFLLVVVAWVFFRAPSFDSALRILASMFAPAMVALPSEIAYHFGADILSGISWGQGMSFADFTAFFTYLFFAYLIIFFAPNTSEIYGFGQQHGFARQPIGRTRSAARVLGTAALAWAVGFGVFSAAPSEFLYFKF